MPNTTKQDETPSVESFPKDRQAGYSSGKKNKPIDMSKSSAWLDGFMEGVRERLHGIKGGKP